MSKRATLADNQKRSFDQIKKNVKKVTQGDTQDDVMKKTGIPQSTYSKQLSDKPQKEKLLEVNGKVIKQEVTHPISLSTLIAISDGYKVPLPELVKRPEDDIHYRRKTLHDAAQAILTLDSLLGLNVVMDTDGRPVISFQYSGLDSFILTLASKRAASKFMTDEEIKRVFIPAIKQKLDDCQKYPEELSCIHAVKETKKMLPYYLQNFGQDAMLHYESAMIDTKAEMQKSTLGSGSGAPQILVTIYDSERRKDTEIFQETFPELPPEESRNLLKESMLALLDDVPEKDREIDPELLLRLFSE